MKSSSPTSGRLANWLGRFWMWLFRWDVVGQVPERSKFVLIGAPHTSNWDFPFTIAAAAVLRLRISWLGKDALFRGPVGILMRWLGGIAVDRNAEHGLVDQVAERFRDSSELVVAIAPCGTRKKGDYWRSGFYWIAHTAQVPILCGFLDYAEKRAGVGLILEPTGDIEADMARIRAFYSGIQGRRPELASTIRLLVTEDGPEAASHGARPSSPESVGEQGESTPLAGADASKD